MLNKTLLTLHNDCDGISNLPLALLYKYPFDDLYIFDYKEREEEGFMEKITESFSKIIFADFSPTLDQLNVMLEKGKTVEVYDHHESSKELLTVTHSNYKIIHDQEKSGTELFYENCIKPLIKEEKGITKHFVKLVGTYDLYKTEDPLWEEAQNLNRALYGFMNWEEKQYRLYKKYVDKIINKLYYNSEWSWDEDERKVIDKDKKKEDRLFNDVKFRLQKRVDSKGNTFALFTARSKISIICHRLLEEIKDLKYVICINTFDSDISPGWMKLSARSRSEEEFDTLQLEGFNGHKCASGRECEIEFSKGLFTGEISEVGYQTIE